MRSFILFGSFFALTVGCRAVPPSEKEGDTAGMSDPTIASMTETNEDSDMTDDVDDSGFATNTDDTGIAETSPCNYELYVIGLSEDAVDQGYEIGLNCFPTRPYLGLHESGGRTEPADGDHLGFDWDVVAAPEGDVYVDSVYGSIDLFDDHGANWSESFGTLDGVVSHVRTYGYDSDDFDDYDWRELGYTMPYYSSDGFSINIGSWGGMDPVFVEKGMYGTVWLSIDFTEPFETGDSVVLEQSPIVMWHADNVPMVMTTEDIDYKDGDYVYVVTLE